MSTCADTTYLSDLFRRQLAAVQSYGRYVDAGEDMVTTFLNLGELFSGAYDLPEPQRSVAELSIIAAVSGFRVLGIEPNHVQAAARAYARVDSFLRNAGSNIPKPDKLTIAVANAHGVYDFVTRDLKHFRRVPWIRVAGY